MRFSQQEWTPGDWTHVSCVSCLQVDSYCWATGGSPPCAYTKSYFGNIFHLKASKKALNLCLSTRSTHSQVHASFWRAGWKTAFIFMGWTMVTSNCLQLLIPWGSKSFPAGNRRMGNTQVFEVKQLQNQCQLFKGTSQITALLNEKMRSGEKSPPLSSLWSYIDRIRQI